MASSGSVNEPQPSILLLPNVSYVIECICFKEISMTF